MTTITLGNKSKYFIKTQLSPSLSPAFLACWWPYVIVFMVGWRSGSSWENHSKLLMDLVTLAYLNSLINPILYILINRDVRTSIKAACLSTENSTMNSPTLI